VMIEIKTELKLMRNHVLIFFTDDSLIFHDVKSISVSESGKHYLNLTTGKKFIVNTGWLYIEIEGEWTA
jgi:hypothetical protein